MRSRSRSASASVNTTAASSDASYVPNRRRISARASESLWRISRATASASTVATPLSRSIAATVLFPQPMLPVRPMTFMSPPMLALGLAMRTEVSAPLAHHDALDPAPASVAWLLRSPIHRQPFRVLPGLAVRADVIAEARAAVRDPLAQDLAYCAMKPSHFTCNQRVRGAQRMESRAPQRLVRVDVPDAGDEALVEEQRLELRGSS